MLKLLMDLHRDERGAEGLEKILIIAAIVLPLLGVLIAFRGAISDWVENTWGDVASEGGNFDSPDIDAP